MARTEPQSTLCRTGLGALRALFVITTLAFPRFAHGQEPPTDVTFVVVGHIYPGIDQPEILQAAVRQINALDIDGVFLLGDLVRGDDEGEWKQLRKFLDALNAPWFAVPGNHDISPPEGRQRWATHIGTPLHHHVVLNDHQFILLDSNVRKSNGEIRPELDDDQRAFLTAALENANDYHGNFVMFHHVLWLPNSILTNRFYGETHWKDRVAPLLSGKVDAVFAGDVHSYFHSNADGIPCYAVGWPQTVLLVGGREVPHQQIYHSKPFFLVVRFVDGVVRSEAVAVKLDTASTLLDTARVPEKYPRKPGIDRLKALVRLNLHVALPVIAAGSALAGALAATYLLRRRRPKAEQSEL